MAKKAIPYAVVDAFAAEPFRDNPDAVCLLEDGVAAKVPLCGHATLTTAHFLFTAVLAKHRDVIEFATKSGVLTAKKVNLFIELDLPMSDFVECSSAGELPAIPETLNGASIVSVHKSATTSDLIVELSSGEEVTDLLPNIEEIRKCAGRGVIFTAPPPVGSGYDMFSRFFCPKIGVDEASPRSGTLYLELDVANRRVRIQGEAVTVMAGTLLA